MRATTKATKKNHSAVAVQEPEMLPASCELPPEVHAKVSAAARANERSFSAQLRMIAREWATNQPAPQASA